MSVRFCLKSLPSSVFKQAYVEDNRITEWFRKVFAMTLVPSSLVDDYWENVIMVEYNSLKGEFPKLTNFVEYIEFIL